MLEISTHAFWYVAEKLQEGFRFLPQRVGFTATFIA